MGGEAGAALDPIALVLVRSRVLNSCWTRGSRFGSLRSTSGMNLRKSVSARCSLLSKASMYCGAALRRLFEGLSYVQSVKINQSLGAGRWARRAVFTIAIRLAVGTRLLAIALDLLPAALIASPRDPPAFLKGEGRPVVG